MTPSTPSATRIGRDLCCSAPLGLLSFLGLWWGLSASGFVAKQFLPTPLEVVARITPPADRALRRRHPARASRPQLRALRLRLRAGGRGRRAARPADGLVPLARRDSHAGVRRPALHRADRLGAVRGAVVRHRHRRPDHDHLLGRLSAVPDQCLPRRPVRRPHLYRGGADAGHGQPAHDPAGAAAGVVPFDRGRPADRRRARLAVARRRGADRGVRQASAI